MSDNLTCYRSDIHRRRYLQIVGISKRSVVHSYPTYSLRRPREDAYSSVPMKEVFLYKRDSDPRGNRSKVSEVSKVIRSKVIETFHNTTPHLFIRCMKPPEFVVSPRSCTTDVNPYDCEYL